MPIPTPITYRDGHLTLQLYWSAKLGRPALRISDDCDSWDYEDCENVASLSRELRGLTFAQAADLVRPLP